ncbi:YebG family protein [Gallaecimonas sp. GXIMD4217]|uniref:YebG family protein n=1 Tax=Gallaecimonas sp. GXIMD4217 TaxID=3131927 RepID=UPI00311AD87D
MAVVIQYVVVREGVEKMTFTSKKEADAYDKLLDTADALAALLEKSPVELDDKAVEELSFYLASNKDQLLEAIKGAKPAPAAKKKTEKKETS